MKNWDCGKKYWNWGVRRGVYIIQIGITSPLNIFARKDENSVHVFYTKLSRVSFLALYI